MTLPLQAVAPRTYQLFQEGCRNSLHLGGQVYVSLGGKVVIDDALGEATPGSPMTADHSLPWRSAGKPLAAAAILRFQDAGRFELDQPIADVLPEFARAGKGDVTARHLLTHTMAFEGSSSQVPRGEWHEIIDHICRLPIRSGWKLGQQACYEPVRSWYILGELLRVLDGRPIEQFFYEEWFEPLGMHETRMSSGSGLQANRSAAADSHRIAPLFVRQGSKLLLAPELHHTHTHVPSPGSSLRGPIRELGRFYEMLLQQGILAGKRFLLPQTVFDIRTRHRTGLFDEMLQHHVDWGLGVIVDSNHYGMESVPYGFGRRSSSSAFGHGGVQSSMAFADPEHRLVVALVFNGCPGEPRHQQRMRNILTTLYDDLGLEPGQAAHNSASH